MNTLTKILILTIAAMVPACTMGYTASNGSYPANSPPVTNVSLLQQGGVSLQIFYDQLSPHGTWVSYQNYGYVWMPNAGPDFQPYATAGHWVFTDMGWTWYSTYSWGWAPFHYGRWFFDNSYGWMWLPDTQWGPAWVTWRSGGDYYGWAPMEPGINISIAFGGTYQPPVNRWIFVRNGDIDRHNVYSYTINQTNNTTIINNTTVIQNTRQDRQRNEIYMAGPDRDDVQRVKGKPVNQVVIQDHDRPGQKMNGQEMKIYKPHVQEDQNDDRRSAPVKVEELNKVKPANERSKAKTQPNPSPASQDNKDQNNGKSKKSGKKKGNN